MIQGSTMDPCTQHALLGMWPAQPLQEQPSLTEHLFTLQGWIKLVRTYGALSRQI